MLSLKFILAFLFITVLLLGVTANGEDINVDVRETQNINITLGKNSYQATYDKTNGIIVVTKNRGFHLGPLMQPGDQENQSDDDDPRPVTKNPLLDLLQGR